MKKEMRDQLAPEIVEKQKDQYRDCIYRSTSHVLGLEFKSQQTLYNEIVRELLYGTRRILGSGIQGWVIQVSPTYCVKIFSREGAFREFKKHTEIYHGYISKIKNSEYTWLTKPRNTNFDERVNQGQGYLKLIFSDDGRTWTPDMPDHDDNWMKSKGLLTDRGYSGIASFSNDIKKDDTIKVRFVDQRVIHSFVDRMFFKSTMYYVPLHKLGFYAQDIAGSNIQTLAAFLFSTGFDDHVNIVARDIGKSLRQLHMIGFTHQDLHFSNVLVVHHTHTTPRIKFIDWGMAEKIREYQTIDVSRPGEDIATYYSPRTEKYERIEFWSGNRWLPQPPLLQKKNWKKTFKWEEGFEHMKAGWLAGQDPIISR